MKKKIITATVATGLLAAGVLTSNNVAKADTVPTGDNTKTNEIATQESNGKEIAQSNVNKAQTNLDLAKEATKTASDNLQAAKTTEEIATKALDSQNQQIKNAQDKVNRAQQQVSEAQANVNKAEDNVAQATDENIQAAKDNISNQEKVVADAQSKENQANKAVATQNAEVSKAQADVNKAQGGVADTQIKVNEAQANVDKIKQYLNSTNVQEAIENANKAEAQVNQDKQDVATAQTNLNNAKKADATRQANIDNAQKTVNQAQANVDFTAKQSQKMKEQLAGFQDLQNRAQKTVDDLNDRLNNVKTIINIKNTEAYKKAFNNWYAGTTFGENWTDEDKNFLTNFRRSNKYKDNNDDKNIVVDVNHLTDDQIKELTLFSADLLNQVRSQLGLPKVIVTTGALKFVKDVTDNYVQDNWDKIDHDNEGISRAAGKNGLLTGGNFYEDAQFYPQFSNTNTMNGLKKAAYNGIVNMIGGSGGEMLHAAGLLGVSFGEDISTAKEQYFATGASVVNIHDDYRGFAKYSMIHFVNIYDRLIKDETKFDKTPVEIPSTDNLIAQLNTAKSNLSIANDKLAQAKQADKDAQAILAKHENALKVANANLNKAKSVATQTPQAQQALITAQAKLANDIKANEDAQAKKVAVLGDQAAKQQLLNKANEALITAQNNLNTAKASLSNANNKLNTEKRTLADLQKQADAQSKAVKDAQDKLNEFKNKLSDLQNATQILLDAQNKLTETKAVLATLQNQLNTEKAKLPELQNSLSKAQADVVAAQKDYDTKVAAQKLAQSDIDDAKKVLQAIYDREALEAQIAAQEKAKHTHFTRTANGEVVDEKGHIMVGYTVKGNQIFNERGEIVGTLTKEPTTRMMKRAVVKANELPQAGNKKETDITLSGAVVTALGSVLALIGLGKREDLD